MAILTLTEIKSYMRNEIVGVDDTVYQLGIDGASEAINAYCQRQFALAGAATARLYRPESWQSRVLRIHDCTTITAVTDNATTLTVNDWQAEPLNGLGWDGLVMPFEQIRRVNSYWSWVSYTQATVSVTATWGWTEIPAKVKMAAYIIAKDIIKQRDVNSGVAGFGDFGAVRVRQNPLATSLLDPLRRVETVGIA